MYSESVATVRDTCQATSWLQRIVIAKCAIARIACGRGGVGFGRHSRDETAKSPFCKGCVCASIASKVAGAATCTISGNRRSGFLASSIQRSRPPRPPHSWLWTASNSGGGVEATFPPSIPLLQGIRECGKWGADDLWQLERRRVAARVSVALVCWRDCQRFRAAAGAESRIGGY